ncbi:unnamed protein product [Protopolystoma xenopodis]|uniref:Uncharacterized protein n=1 Tax=Protopolystoma xenopodis TaxID=117903 RepID=A0A3S4ZCX9_9PLAT|nr:unnamed protein product [Protopolystoma xenopodis]
MLIPRYLSLCPTALQTDSSSSSVVADDWSLSTPLATSDLLNSMELTPGLGRPSSLFPPPFLTAPQHIPLPALQPATLLPGHGVDGLPKIPSYLAPAAALAATAALNQTTATGSNTSAVASASRRLSPDQCTPTLLAKSKTLLTELFSNRAGSLGEADCSDKPEKSHIGERLAGRPKRKKPNRYCLYAGDFADVCRSEESKTHQHQGEKKETDEVICRAVQAEAEEEIEEYGTKRSRPDRPITPFKRARWIEESNNCSTQKARSSLNSGSQEVSPSASPVDDELSPAWSRWQHRITAGLLVDLGFPWRWPARNETGSSGKRMDTVESPDVSTNKPRTRSCKQTEADQKEVMENTNDNAHKEDEEEGRESGEDGERIADQKAWEDDPVEKNAQRSRSVSEGYLSPVYWAVLPTKRRRCCKHAFLDCLEDQNAGMVDISQDGHNYNDPVGGKPSEFPKTPDPKELSQPANGLGSPVSPELPRQPTDPLDQTSPTPVRSHLSGLHVLRFGPGQEVTTCLTEHLRRHRLSEALVVAGSGTVLSARLQGANQVANVYTEEADGGNEKEEWLASGGMDEENGERGQEEQQQQNGKDKRLAAKETDDKEVEELRFEETKEETKKAETDGILGRNNDMRCQKTIENTHKLLQREQTIGPPAAVVHQGVSLT